MPHVKNSTACYVLLKRTVLSQPVPSQAAACTSPLEDCHPNSVLLHLQNTTSGGGFATDILLPCTDTAQLHSLKLQQLLV